MTYNKSNTCDKIGCSSCNQANTCNQTKKAKETQELDERLNLIKHKIMILSGKGGVGKSTVATNIAVSLAIEGSKGQTILPIEFIEGVKVMSIGFLLPNPDDAVIWRGPMKIGVIKQLLTQVEWGELDYLIIDFPPGTSDEPLSVTQLIPNPDGAIVVTTPQDLSIDDVRRCITFCKQVNVPVLGVLENMSGLACPHCNTIIDIFKTGGGEKMATDMDTPFLGSIPIDPQIVESSDAGEPFVYYNSKTETAKSFSKAIQPILNLH